jgi:hypothetical protein
MAISQPQIQRKLPSVADLVVYNILAQIDNAGGNFRNAGKTMIRLCHALGYSVETLAGICATTLHMHVVVTPLAIS